MTCAVTNHDRSTGGSENAGLLIRSSVGECWLGSVLVATTDRGICAILLGDDFAHPASRPGGALPAGAHNPRRSGARPGHGQSRGFHRNAGAGARSAARPPRHGVRAAGLASTTRDPGGLDGELWRGRATDRRIQGGVCHRRGVRSERHRRRDSLPPRRAQGRRTCRLSVGIWAQAGPLERERAA